MEERLKNQVRTITHERNTCQSYNLGHYLHCIDEPAIQKGQRTKGREENKSSHLGGIRYYSQHLLVMRRERKEKPKDRNKIMLKKYQAPTSLITYWRLKDH